MTTPAHRHLRVGAGPIGGVRAFEVYCRSRDVAPVAAQAQPSWYPPWRTSSRAAAAALNCFSVDEPARRPPESALPHNRTPPPH